MRLARSPRRSVAGLVVLIAAAAGCSSSSPAGSGAGGRGGGVAGEAGANAGTAGGVAGAAGGSAGAGGTAAGGSGASGASGTAGASAGSAGTSVGSGGASGANGGTAGGASGAGGAGATGAAGHGGSAAAGTSGGTAGAAGAAGGASGSAGVSGAGGSAAGAGYYITGDVDGVTIRAEMGAVAYWWSGIIAGTIALDASTASWSWSLIVVNGTNVSSNCSGTDVALYPPGHPEMGFAKANGVSCSEQVTQAAPNVGDILEGNFTATLVNVAHTQTKQVTNGHFRVPRVAEPPTP